MNTSNESFATPLPEIENSEGEKNISFREQGYEGLLRINGIWYNPEKNRLLFTLDFLRNEFGSMPLPFGEVDDETEDTVLDLNNRDLASLFNPNSETMMENVFHRVCGGGTPFKLFPVEGGYEFHVSSRARAIEIAHLLVDVLDTAMVREYCYDEDDEESNDSDSLNAMSKILFFGGILVGIAFFLGRWFQ